MTQENEAEGLWDVAPYLQQTALWMRMTCVQILQQHEVLPRMQNGEVYYKKNIF
jgi:hypothetical protein